MKTLKGLTFTVSFLLFTVIFSSCGSTKGLVIAENEVDLVQNEETVAAEEEKDSAIDLKEETSATLFVYVCGAVEEPGVYELPEQSRINEAVNAAGGMRKDAKRDAINLASYVEDGMQIRIPTVEEALAEEAEAKAVKDADGRLNLNTASKEDLMTLPGVGESKADSIIAYRTEHGGYQSVEEVMNITGIKEGVFAKFKDLVYVK